LSKLLVLFSRLADGVKQIHVCTALANKTDGLFDYGIQLIDSYANNVKDNNRLFIDQYYWEVERYEDFVNISYLTSSNDFDFEGTFGVAFYYFYNCKRKAKYCNYIGLFNVIKFNFSLIYVFYFRNTY
jgi:hypothetical protein